MAVGYSQHSSPEQEPVCDPLGPAAATSQTHLKDLLNTYLQPTACVPRVGLVFQFVIAIFISGRARVFPLKSAALDFGNPGEFIIMQKATPAPDLSLIHFPRAFRPTLLRIKYINSNQ